MDIPGEQVLLRRQVKWLLLLRVTLLSFILGVSSLLKFRNPNLNIPDFSSILSFIVLIYLYSIASALLAYRIRRYTLLAYTQVFTDSILTSLIVYYSGGSQSIFTFVYFFPIISGSLMLFKPGAFVMSLFTLLNYGTVLSSELNRLAPLLPGPLAQNPVTNPFILLQHFSVYGASFFMVGILSSILADRLKKTEAALTRTSRNYIRLSRLYKQIFDNISSGLITVDSDSVVTSFNRAAEQITGYEAFELTGKGFHDFFPGFDRPGSDSERLQTEIRRKDGKKIPLGYSWSRLNMPDPADDSRVYTFQDLSRIRRMEEKVRQSEKMAAVGEIAAGIAHEFRNPLAAISGAAQVLAGEESASSVNQSLFNIITRESTRLDSIIKDFLLFSRPARPEKSWTSLKERVDETWAVIRQGGLIREEITLVTDIPGNLDCWADPRQLAQILLNLIHNACVAMEKEGGEVTVVAREVPGQKEGNLLRIRIEDTGCGIEEHMRGDIFEPFFTTRENGTGLGLAIVHQLVDGHGGTISVGGGENGGTVFTLALPLP